MRIVLSLLTCLLLAGCPQASNTPTASSSTPRPTPASPSPDTTPAAEIPVDSFVGTWTTEDEQGQAFDIVIFPNGQIVTNWAKGPLGPRGERGFWRRETGRLLATYQDGWTDILTATQEGFEHKGFSPGTPLSAAPTNQAAAQRLSDEGKTAYIGVWRLNQEPDGSYLYVALQSNGRALSTINGGTEGKWEVTEKGAVCTWPDGWVDVISRGAGNWQRSSWVGSETNAPADFSEATRVGEAPFSIEP